MSEVKCYIKVDASKELPKEYDKYHVMLISGAKITAYYKKDWIIPFDEIITDSVTHWLKEISLTKPMEEFADWLLNNFESDPESIDPRWFDLNYKMHNTKQVYYRSGELLQTFLTSKGIIK